MEYWALSFLALDAIIWKNNQGARVRKQIASWTWNGARINSSTFLVTHFTISLATYSGFSPDLVVVSTSVIIQNWKIYVKYAEDNNFKVIRDISEIKITKYFMFCMKLINTNDHVSPQSVTYSPTIYWCPNHLQYFICSWQFHHWLLSMPQFYSGKIERSSNTDL